LKGMVDPEHFVDSSLKATAVFPDHASRVRCSILARLPDAPMRRGAQAKMNHDLAGKVYLLYDTSTPTFISSGSETAR